MKTKTFTENRWWRKNESGKLEPIPPQDAAETEQIDAQVARWVAQTGAVIAHPGQLGMHTSWHGDADDPYQLKCLTLGLVVLYQEG